MTEYPADMYEYSLANHLGNFSGEVGRLTLSNGSFFNPADPRPPHSPQTLGTPDDDILRAGNFGDTLYGEGGNDVLDGGPFHDVLYGGLGNDYLIGGYGWNVLDGGPGFDFAFYTAESLNGIVADLRDGSVIHNSFLSKDALHEIEGIVGTPRNDTIVGDDGNNAFFGTAGHDSIYGLGASDIVSGGDGNDILDGGAGADRLVGGAGVDLIAGGSGSDSFTLLATDPNPGEFNLDVILDFTRLEGDKIDLTFTNVTHFGGRDVSPEANEVSYWHADYDDDGDKDTIVSFNDGGVNHIVLHDTIELVMLETDFVF